MINFKAYLFRQGEEKFYVFHGIWEEKYVASQTLMETEPLSRKQRISTVLQGKRNLGQKILGVSISGPNSFEEATFLLKDTLNEIIIPFNG
jgi:hypothetical protein